jgi:two-component system NtrC family sensor kinase
VTQSVQFVDIIDWARGSQHDARGSDGAGVHDSGLSTGQREGRKVYRVAAVSPDASDDALIGLNRLATVARLLSGAAHEVNNALQVISGTVEVLESRADVPSATQAALARMRGQSSRAAAALGQVMQFARAPRGGTGPVDMREVVEESLALRDFSIRRARLTARIDADPAAIFLVTGNRADLQQALLNVLINAEHALEGPTGTIAVQLSAEGGSVVVRVIDNGPGIVIDPPERAFEPFVTTGDPFEEPGLGLWTARKLAERHGGTLEIEPRSDGAAFVMRLPERRVQERPRHHARPAD